MPRKRIPNNTDRLTWFLFLSWRGFAGWHWRAWSFVTCCRYAEQSPSLCNRRRLRASVLAMLWGALLRYYVLSSCRVRRQQLPVLFTFRHNRGKPMLVLWPLLKTLHARMLLLLQSNRKQFMAPLWLWSRCCTCSNFFMYFIIIIINHMHLLRLFLYNHIMLPDS